METTLVQIAHIENGFETKFGIPRQSGMVLETESKIIFEPTYNNIDAVRGLEGFSHIWLLWEFSKAKRETWSPTVRPPRLGGNKRMGVFATRSPFRPNPIGLSCVRLDRIEFSKDRGPILIVRGADLLNGTPIYDIKPYLKFTDSHEDAVGGFADEFVDYKLNVIITQEATQGLDNDFIVQLKGLLQSDPRPSYQKDKDRVYGLEFLGYEVKFTVENEDLTVTEIYKK